MEHSDFQCDCSSRTTRALNLGALKASDKLGQIRRPNQENVRICEYGDSCWPKSWALSLRPKLRRLNQHVKYLSRRL